MFKGRHFDRAVILLCVRRYLAYNLSLRDLEEMMAERGLSVYYSTVHRWVVRFSPQLLERFNRRKRTVTGKRHMDETYIKVRGQWMYLYRAIDSIGDTVEFFFSEHRDLVATKRFLRKALQRHGRPERIVIDVSQTNREAILSCELVHLLRKGPHRLGHGIGRDEPVLETGQNAALDLFACDGPVVIAGTAPVMVEATVSGSRRGRVRSRYRLCHAREAVRRSS